MDHFVILGAGECGARAAFALREKGFDGDITLVGAELLHPYERPPLSKAGIADTSDPKFIAAAEKYAESNIRLRTGVEAGDFDTTSRTVTLSDGTMLSYDKLLLATGASARSFPGAPENSPHIRSLRTHHDAAALRGVMKPGRHIAIIGGGFIGLELAATARLLGAEVTVIEGLERVLKRGVPEEIAHLLTERHRAEGVEIRCGVSIEALTEEGGKAVIRLSTGEVIEADLALVGIGAGRMSRSPKRPGSQSKTALPSIHISRPQRLTFLPPATAAPSRCRSMAAGGCGSNPGATPRNRAHWPRPTCSAAMKPFHPCRGSGRINTT